MKAVTSDQMRAIESEAVRQGVDLGEVMERAGSQVARLVNASYPKGSVLILVGPGNNGGDGLAAAHALNACGRDVRIYSCGRGADSDHSDIAAESDHGQAVLRVEISRAAVVVDALLGTGQSRPVQGLLEAVVDEVNRRDRSVRVVSVDVPTGVSGTTGEILGVAVHADQTLCIALPKLGVLIGPGREASGRIVVAEVGIAGSLAPPDAPDVPTVSNVAALFPKRPAISNKGTFGRLFVVAGSRSFMGAPALVGESAVRSGTGLVELAAIDDVRRSVAARVPEIVYQPVPEENGQIAPAAVPAIEQAIRPAQAVAVGPGLGSGEGVREVVLDTLRSAQDSKLVADADALNVLAGVQSWWDALPRSSVITPHPGEMARLTGEAVANIQGDRIAVTRRFAGKWSTVVVLKGSATVVAAPDGRVSINPTGGPNLATAGTGDVLTGVVGALLAQGLDPWEAAVLGVYWHGAAGDVASAYGGRAGTAASDLPALLPFARRLIRVQGERR